MDCSPPKLLSPKNSPGKNTGVGCHSLLQGIFQTQGSNLGLLHCRKILYHMNHQGSPSLLILRLSFKSLKSLLSEKTNSSAQALDSTFSCFVKDTIVNDLLHNQFLPSLLAHTQQVSLLFRNKSFWRNSWPHDFLTPPRQKFFSCPSCCLLFLTLQSFFSLPQTGFYPYMHGNSCHGGHWWPIVAKSSGHFSVLSYVTSLQHPLTDHSPSNTPASTKPLCWFFSFLTNSFSLPFYSGPTLGWLYSLLKVSQGNLI